MEKRFIFEKESLVDLEKGKEYIFKLEKVTLEDIRIRHSYRIKTRFLFFKSVEVVAEPMAILSTKGQGLVEFRAWCVSLDKFIKGLTETHKYENELNKSWAEFNS